MNGMSTLRSRFAIDEICTPRSSATSERIIRDQKRKLRAISVLLETANRKVCYIDSLVSVSYSREKATRRLVGRSTGVSHALFITSQNAEYKVTKHACHLGQGEHGIRSNPVPLLGAPTFASHAWRSFGETTINVSTKRENVPCRAIFEVCHHVPTVQYILRVGAA
jgi:hypothetical protein